MFIGPCITLIVEERETNLMSLALLFHYLMLNRFRMLIHPTSGACDLFVELFHGLHCSGSMCVGVTLWFGWGGVVSGCGFQPASGYHKNNEIIKPVTSSWSLFIQLSRVRDINISLVTVKGTENKSVKV